MQKPKIITLTTDFGLKDAYVAMLKAAVLGICPEASIIDITHSVEKFNVSAGAFVMASAASFFPDGTIHVGVVDPGVGSKRRSLLIETKHGFFIGPDNGLLAVAAEAQSIARIFEITSRRLMMPNVSNTFHGRDIFAPAAAHLLNGIDLEEFGPQINDFAKPSFGKTKRKKGILEGEVLHIDDFGNIITNLHSKEISGYRKEIVQITLPNHSIQVKFSHTYANAQPQEPIALVGSHNYLEIALNQGSAAAKYEVKTGDKIVFSSP
jgi:S-adenosyl-L-methionine hydrolase (adenosine-forming)